MVRSKCRQRLRAMLCNCEFRCSAIDWEIDCAIDHRSVAEADQCRRGDTDTAACQGSMGRKSCGKEIGELVQRECETIVAKKLGIEQEDFYLLEVHERPMKPERIVHKELT